MQDICGPCIGSGSAVADCVVSHWIFHPVSYIVPSSTGTRLEEYIPPPTCAPHREAEGRDIGVGSIRRC
jgi:hypothetical protein